LGLENFVIDDDLIPDVIPDEKKPLDPPFGAEEEYEDDDDDDYSQKKKEFE